MLRKLFYIPLVYIVLFSSSYKPVTEKKEAYYLQLYKQGKEYYHRKDYIACQKSLDALIKISSPNPLTPYAFFYHALSAYHQANAVTAETTFLKIVQKYPQWPQIEEVFYWLAQINFDKDNYKNAFSYIEQIKSSSFNKSIDQMKHYFLSKIENIELLESILKEYPNDQAIAQTYITKQAQLPFIQKDHKQITTLIQHLKLPKTIYDPLHKLVSTKKDVYHVAVFLPFFIGEVVYEENNNNQFVLDLYKGIQCAIEKLYQEGVHIVLHAYDTKKNSDVTAAILEQKELQTMDLFIGPLYANTTPLVAEFAKTYKINLFNPLSTNSQVVGNNPFIYLLNPSLETQAKKAALFTKKYINTEETNIGIIYGTAAEDSIKANTYKRYIEQYIGKEVSLMLELQAENSQQFLNKFRVTGNKQNATQVTCLDKLTHIYIASQDELIVANVLSAIQIRKLHPCILGDESWLKKSLITLDRLQNLSIHFIAPNYISCHSEDLYNFRNNFYSQFGTYPNYYAEIGYDKMFFLGKMLHQHGRYFQKEWKKGVFPGEIFSGFSYGKHHDNQHVPIIKFEKTNFIVCNF